MVWVRLAVSPGLSVEAWASAMPSALPAAMTFWSLPKDLFWIQVFVAALYSHCFSTTCLPL